MVQQHSQTADYENRYKFTGHELDRETGLYYAGARYYDPKISIWLSVDPLLEKFPNFNPYNYVMQNPINLIDPTGMCPDESDADTSPPLGTYLIIYGAGWDNPQVKTHNQGNSFQKNAEAQKQNLIKSGVPEADIVITKAQTKDEFTKAVNTKYASGEIVQMDVYSHSAANLLNLGGYEGMEPTAGATPTDKDYRYVHIGDMSKIDASNFSKDSKVTLWGCNAGNVHKGAGPIAQIFANHLNLGGSNSVRALNSWSEHKQSSTTGKLIFDGTMIRTIDRATQKVNLTTFKPKP
jgi:RHS repeat-associated protein